jgi:hypothetical protein
MPLHCDNILRVACSDGKETAHWEPDQDVPYTKAAHVTLTTWMAVAIAEVRRNTACNVSFPLGTRRGARNFSSSTIPI